MHDETPAGLATRERTLALYALQTRQDRPRRYYTVRSAVRATLASLAGVAMIYALGIIASFLAA